MKKLAITIFVVLMTIVLSTDIDARVRKHPPWHRPGKQQPVGVPLDGGLLTILGAAGLAYYIARKKKAEK